MPLITILYGNIIPIGVFIYLIVSTMYQVAQQFFTTGWGGMFPLFGRTAFAVDHQPRFPVAVPAAPTSTSRPEKAPARPILIGRPWTERRRRTQRSATAGARAGEEDVR